MNEAQSPTPFARSKTALGWWALFAVIVQEGISYQVLKSLLDGPQGDLSDLVDVVKVGIVTLPFTGVLSAWFYGLYTKKVVLGASTLVMMAGSLVLAGVVSNMATDLPAAVAEVQGIETVSVSGPSSLQAVFACYFQTYGGVLFLLAGGAAAFFGYVAAVWGDEI